MVINSNPRAEWAYTPNASFMRKVRFWEACGQAMIETNITCTELLECLDKLADETKKNTAQKEESENS